MLKRILLVMLALVMVLGLAAGCKNKKQNSSSSDVTSEDVSDIEPGDEDSSSEEESGDPNASDPNSGATTSTSSAKTSQSSRTTSLKPPPIPSGTKISSSKIKVEDANDLLKKLDAKGKAISVLSHWPVDGDDAKLLQKRYTEYAKGGKITFKQAEWDKMPERLSLDVMANQSPDLYSMRPADFPNVIIKGLIQPLQEYTFLTHPAWSAKKQLLDVLNWSGDYYCLGNTSPPGAYIWFNKNLMEEFGVTKTPDQLVAEDKWDWNAFEDIAKKCTDLSIQGQEKYGFGETTNLEFQYMAQYGVDLITFKNGKAVNNVGNPLLDEAMIKYESFYADTTTYMCKPTDSVGLFRYGRLAMIYGPGYWDGMKGGQFNSIRKNAEPDTITFTYFPRKPGTTKYVYAETLGGWAIPYKAKNPVEAGMLIVVEYMKDAYMDKTLSEEGEKYLWTAKEKQTIKDSYTKTEGFMLYMLGFYKAYAYFGNDVMVGITQQNKTWATLKTQLKPKVDEAIKDYEDLRPN